MKVYLINPDYMLYANAPLGLAYLAAYIKQEIPDIETKILDQISHKKIIEIIEREKPDVVGITSVSDNWFNVKKLAKNIKKTGKVKRMVLGGVHITTYPKCFENSSFDYGIRGEGEITFTKLLKLIKENKEKIINLKKIMGLLIRTKKKIINTGVSEQIKDLEKIPLPALNMLNMKYYSLPSFSRSTFLLLTSRGCPYNCSFCSSSYFWESKIRFFSAERVVREIEILYKKYGFTFISIGDDLFAINKERIKKIIHLLKEKKILGKIEFNCGGRANLFDEEMASLLKELGVKGIAFGFESGSDKILKYLKGGNVTVKDNKRAVHICKKYGLIVHGFFMIGTPYETLNDMEETYQFIKKYCKDSFIIYQTLAYPGTEVWNYAIRNNIIKEDMYERDMGEFVDSNTQHLLTKEVSKEDFEKIYKRIRDLNVKNIRLELIQSLKRIQLRDIPSFFSILFIKKMWNLKERFFKRIK